LQAGTGNVLQDSFERQRGRYAVHLRVAGVVIRLECSQEGPAGVLLPSLQENQIPAPPGEADFAIAIWEDEEVFTHSPVIDELRRYRDRVSVSHQGSRHLFYNPEGEIFCFIDTDINRAWYCVADRSALPDYEVCTPMRFLLHWILAARGLVFTHAASVGRNGRGVLLVGRGGAGKSTTALACHLNGLEFLGDDYVAVEPESPAHAFHIYRGAKLTDDTLPRFPELSRRLHPTNKTQNKNVVMLNHSDGPIVRSLPVAAVLRPRIGGGGRTTISPAAPSVILMEMATSTVLQAQGGGQHILSGLAALCRGVPCYDLELGGDFGEIPRSIGRFIDSLGARG
jgi:hypothetical protein